MEPRHSGNLWVLMLTEGITVTQMGSYTMIEFYDRSMMDPIKLQELEKRLFALIDDEDRRQIVLDFTRVQFVASQFIGILIAMNKKLAALPRGRLVLCGVGPRLTELLRITRLDKVLHVRNSREEAFREK